jgi:hypothetical protein
VVQKWKQFSAHTRVISLFLVLVCPTWSHVEARGTAQVRSGLHGVKHCSFSCPLLTHRLIELMSFYKLLPLGFQDCDLITKGKEPKELGIKFIGSSPNFSL